MLALQSSQAQNRLEMSRSGEPRPKTLVLLGLFLTVLANLGLSVHSGHHSVGVPHTGTTVQVLAGHSTPDPTLHLEASSEIRMLTCPGCVLHSQIGGSHLRPAQRTVPLPDAGRLRLVLGQLPVHAPISKTLSRGPPSC